MSQPNGDFGQQARKPGVIPLRPLTLNEILEAAVRTIRVQPKLMLGASLVVVALAELVGALIGLRTMAAANAAVAEMTEVSMNPIGHEDQLFALLGKVLLSSLPSIGLTLVVQAFLAGLLTVVVGKAVLGQRIGLASALAEARPRLFPLLVLTVAYTLLVAIGAMFFVVPGVWLYVLLALATPALVLERGPILESFRRSVLLVRGAWWRTCGFLLVATIAVYVIGMLVQFPVDAATGVRDTGVITTSYVWWTALAATISGSFTRPFLAATTALVYIDRRIRVERMDVQLARAAGDDGN